MNSATITQKNKTTSGRMSHQKKFSIGMEADHNYLKLCKS